MYAINSRESFQLLDQVKKEYDKNKEKKEVCYSLIEYHIKIILLIDAFL